MKAGNSLFVPVPYSVVELWGLQKGAQVQIEVTADEMRITPIATIRGQQVRQEDLQRFWEAMREVEVRICIEDDGSSLRVQFSGSTPDVARALAQNLRRALPAVLSMLGIQNRDERQG